MKTILKNATLLPEYGFEGKQVNVLIKNKKIFDITENVPADFRADELFHLAKPVALPGGESFKRKPYLKRTD